MDLFLKFESAQQAEQYLYNEVIEYRNEHGFVVQPVVNADGTTSAPVGTTSHIVKVPKFVNLDIIGDINKETSETQEIQGPHGHTITVPVLQKLEGYHVNVRVIDEDVSEIEGFAITPSNPVRVWA